MPLFLAFIATALLLAPSWGPWGQWAEPAKKSSSELFTDVSRKAGITWSHFNGQSQDRFLIEASYGGVAFLDYDNDGWLDIFFVNGGETPRGKSQEPVRNALYRNLGNGRFEDVAESAGVAQVPFYGMGVASADVDNDGFQDLYVTGFPSSALFHNEGDGTFSEVTQRAGVGNAGEWAASAVWFDYDRDGQLDLFVCNYAELSFAQPRNCSTASGPDLPGLPASLGRSWAGEPASSTTTMTATRTW